MESNMGYEFELAGELVTVHPIYGDRIDPWAANLRIGADECHARLSPGLNAGEYSLELDGQTERLFIATEGDTHFIHFRGCVHRVDAPNALDRARREAAPASTDEVLRAPMPGTVVSVATKEGAHVARGTLLLTIESMKLETAISAPREGIVARIHVAAGDNFEQGDGLIQLDSIENEEDSK